MTCTVNHLLIERGAKLRAAAHFMMEETMEHTPIPWGKRSYDGDIWGFDFVIVTPNYNDSIWVGGADAAEANAAFIVRAVNNHYKLLAALEASEAYSARIHTSSPPWDDCLNGGCFWCSDCANRVINMRREAIKEARK